MSHGVHKGGGAHMHRQAGGVHGEMLLVVDSLGSSGDRIEGRAKDGQEGIPPVLSSVSPCRAIESRRSPLCVASTAGLSIAKRRRKSCRAFNA